MSSCDCEKQDRFANCCKIKRLEKELAEEQRLNSMGSEREARLMARISELEKENARLKANLECVGTHTCHDNCQNPMCLLYNENGKLRAEVQIGRERLGPAGWRILQEVITLRSMAEAAERFVVHESNNLGTHGTILKEAVVNWRREND